MLCVRGVSGKELTVIGDQEVADVSTLKRFLRELHGWPLCMQKLLQGDSILDDSTKLKGPLEICLVLESLSCQEKQVIVQASAELADCASQSGLVKTARLLLDAVADMDMEEVDCEEFLQDAFDKAAEHGNVEIARLLLEAGLNRIWDRESAKVDALSSAAKQANIEMARLLLEGDFAVDLGSLHNDDRLCLEEDCLAIVCSQGQADFLRLLVKAEVDLEFPISDVSPLSLAAGNGHEEILRLLIQGGAAVNRLDRTGNTALTCAAMNGHVEIARILVDANADLDLHSHWAKTAVFWDHGRMHRCEVDKTALMWAVTSGHVETARLLLKAQADPDARRQQVPPLALAARDGHGEIVRLLIEAGADVNRVDYNCSTALIGAAMNGHVDIVQSLADANADLDLQSHWGNTAELWEHVHGQNHQPAILRTAIMWAATNGHVAVTRLLLNAHANKDLKDISGYTALTLASANGHTEIVEMLTDAGAAKFARASKRVREEILPAGTNSTSC